MNYCYECGTKLYLKFHSGENQELPYCNQCHDFRYPFFNSAVSAAILSPDIQKTLLIQQYGKKHNVLLAGYINQGETAEHALIREVQEEIHRQVTQYAYLKSLYFDHTNTLMMSFCCIVDSEDLSQISEEVDQAKWYSLTEAKDAIMKQSIAQKFLLENLAFIETGRFHLYKTIIQK